MKKDKKTSTTCEIIEEEQEGNIKRKTKREKKYLENDRFFSLLLWPFIPQLNECQIMLKIPVLFMKILTYEYFPFDSLIFSLLPPYVQ